MLTHLISQRPYTVLFVSVLFVALIERVPS